MTSISSHFQEAHNRSLSTGTAVRLTGEWKESPNPQAQTHELHVSKSDVLGVSDASVCVEDIPNWLGFR
jgi:aspartyl/asparaginyl-tRNA synthetase